MTLTHRELATVLAALRLWQREGPSLSQTARDLASDGGVFRELSGQEIDGLCERLNFDAIRLCA